MDRFEIPVMKRRRGFSFSGGQIKTGSYCIGRGTVKHKEEGITVFKKEKGCILTDLARSVPRCMTSGYIILTIHLPVPFSLFLDTNQSIENEYQARYGVDHPRYALRGLQPGIECMSAMYKINKSMSVSIQSLESEGYM
jgi:hypothetical protein